MHRKSLLTLSRRVMGSKAQLSACARGKKFGEEKEEKNKPLHRPLFLSPALVKVSGTAKNAASSFEREVARPSSVSSTPTVLYYFLYNG